ncbi:hypothetical protein [Fibrisoma montanum]|uniref:hypothetical protein n=1 Tax=Fibrisoma montanum TaxID=2305895 RepID=UPI001314687E|nr:hypothetical protein [Fibrisoma montanum]
MPLPSVNPPAIGEPTNASPNGRRCHSSAYMTVRRYPEQLTGYRHPSGRTSVAP